jgi:myo-inositol 2-dehydrogenase/D-chiro-inositol 1-dehydrogenase
MLRFAVVGAGRIATAHARSLAANPAAEVTWVADPFPGAADRIAGPIGARATLDPSEAIGAADVDAVLVCSPTPTHVDMILASVAAGKAVLCEKPIDLSLARVDECLRALEGADARVMMGFNRRFDPSFAAVHARVGEGEIGSIEQVIVISRDPAPPPASYVRESGGIFRDMTIHDFDMVRFFLPDIVEVSATGQNLIDPGIKDAGDFDGAVVTLRAASGAVATIVNSRRATYGYDQRLEVFGSAGMLQATNLLPNSVRSYGADHAERTAPYLTFFLERYAEAYAAELAAFIEGVESGSAFSPDLADGRAALVLADAAGQAARSGASVTIPGAA